jgi:hypothetical protein
VTEETKKEKKEKKKRTLLQKIVNVFLYIGLGIFILMVIAFAVSQTSFFRNWLREEAMNIADDALNGKVYIGELDGTIFTSLILHDTYVTMGKDTLLNAGKIEIKTSPLQLLFKKIYIRKFELDDTRINLVRDSSGELNISRLIPPSTTTDTTTSPFPFKIIVADFKIRNTDFSLKDHDIDTFTLYNSINMHNLVVEDLNLSLDAFADIKNNDFEFGIHSLSFKPNIRGFVLNNLSGDFYINNDSLKVDYLRIKTDSSSFWLNAGVNNFSMFDTSKNNDFSRAHLSLELVARKLNLSDISAVVPATDILHGTVAANIQTSGSLKLLNLNFLEISFRNTHLETKGRIENMDAGKNMQITTEFSDTYINQNDISFLLPSLSIPVYNKYGTLKFDSLVYKGNPLNFYMGTNINTDKGSVAFYGNLNFEKKPIAYDLSFITNNFDISPVAGVNTKLTSRGAVKGVGVNPDSLNASIRFFAGGSYVDGNRMDSLKLIADAKSKNINYRLTAISDTTSISLNGSVDFTEQKHPSYELGGDIRNLNLATILKDTSAQTELNFSVNADGQDFNPDSMDLFLSTIMYNSSIHGIKIDTTRAIVDLRKNEGGERVVNIISDLADITLTGDFKIMNVVDLMSTETKIVVNAVKNKLNKLLPSVPAIDSTEAHTENLPVVNEISGDTRMDYVVEFKNFELLSLLLGSKQLELDGYVQGTLKQTADSINFIFQSNLDYLKYWGPKDVFFLSKLNLNLELNNYLDSISLAGLHAGINLNIDRIFTGSDITDLHLGLGVEGDSAAIDFSANLDNYLTANLDSRLHFNSGVDISLDTLLVKYNNFDLSNRNTLNVFYTPDKIDFKGFKLFHKNGSIKIDGTLRRQGSQDLIVSVNGITGTELSQDLLGMLPENSIQSYLNLEAEIKGNFGSPLMNIKLNADSVAYRDKKFGSLIANLNYKAEKLNTDIRFIDSLRNYQNPKLKITGEIPLNLAFSGVKERIIKNAPVDITVTADSFRLGALGNILPEVNRLSGKLTTNLHIGGTFNNFKPEGELLLHRAAFILEKNNLQYLAGLKLSVTPDKIKIDSLLIMNAPGTKNGGQMTGSGEAGIDNLKIVSSDIRMNGQLKVLSDASKSASPSVYGDLVIATQGNINFTSDTSRVFLSVPIEVKEANLTFPQTESSYQNTSNNFIYVYSNDTSKNTGSQADFQTLVDLSRKHNEEQQGGLSVSSSFNYVVDVHVENEAKITFVLSKELNQNLVALLRGDFHYERRNGKTDASGELNLLSGSTLEFLKTFEADGTIRFENQLDNPYLDITATYTDYYYPASDSVSNNEVEVAVKIKIKGFLKEIGKNLVQNQDNIAVYYGAKNIENNTPDPTKTPSDAIFFILTGNFTEGASQQDRYAAASTAASLAGSVLGGFLNKQFGDIIKRVELRQVGTTTKFNLVGKAGDIRYSVGGTTNVFQDISQANVKLEYPITNNLLLRLERKQSVTDANTNNINEMVNELGLKYKFEF